MQNLSENSRCNSQKGFTLFETLIAVIIMAIGLIGMAGLQTKTAVYTEASLYRSQASMLAQEIIERMRSNPTQAMEGAYDIERLPNLTTSCTGLDKYCSVVDIRDHDLAVWSDRVRAALPDGTGTITTVAGAAGEPVNITVILSWDDSRGQKARSTETYSMKLTRMNR